MKINELSRQAWNKGVSSCLMLISSDSYTVPKISLKMYRKLMIANMKQLLIKRDGTRGSE